jgi:hypothetical protein
VRRVLAAGLGVRLESLPLIEADLRRCGEYRLRVVRGTQLARLREHLIEWADGR